MTKSRRHDNTTARPAINGLVVSGLVQIAAGALIGFPYAAAVYKPELLAKTGVKAPGRIRQLHLDLIIMGGSCQRTWEHAIPKSSTHTGPRISIQYRPRGVR